MNKIWKDFKDGKLTMTQVDEMLAPRAEKVSHTLGRYDKYPFWEWVFEEGEAKKTEDDDDYDGSDLEMARLNGDCCKTKEEAELAFKQQEAYLALVDKIHELNDGWTPDWSDYNAHKHSFEYNHDDNELGFGFVQVYQSLRDELYFKTEVIGNQIIKELGVELINLALGFTQ